jgi:hypothetical protein
VDKITLSPLRKSWFIDLDGTVLVHNKDVSKFDDQVIEKSLEFLSSIREDFIVFTTSRESKYKNKTEDFLEKNNIKYDVIIYDLPYGERLIINDNKPSGLVTAYSISVERNKGIDLEILVDNNK